MSMSRNKSTDDTETNLLPAESTTEETDDEILEDAEKAAPPEVFIETSIKLMPTLTQSFNSLVEFPIDITNENRKPQNIITLLGNALGVNDYKTNIASFWFLDFIALQVLRFDADLDDNERGVMVSWLAGEMKLIRDNNLSHQAFLHEMKNIFKKNSERVSRGQPLLHWDLMSAENSTGEIIVEEEIAQQPIEPEVSHPKVPKLRSTSRSLHTRSMSEDRLKGSSKNAERARSNESEVFDINEDMTKSESHSKKILDIFMKATYSMYGDSFHYALIVAAFIKPIELHEYILPFTIREPRPLKMFDIEKYMGQRTTEKAPYSTEPRKSKEIKKKNDKKAKKKQDAEMIELMPEPSTTVNLTEEEILMKKREFILPLMEANEAPIILEEYREMQTK